MLNKLLPEDDGCVPMMDRFGPVVVHGLIGGACFHRHAPTVEARRPAIGTVWAAPFSRHSPLGGYISLVLFMLLNVRCGCDTFAM